MFNKEFSSDFNSWRKTFYLSLFMSFLCVTLFQGTRGLYETTEGRYALCARETLKSGNLLEPIIHGEHHWTKPPLTYIAIAGGLAIFGDDSTWGARFYLIPAFLFTVLFVFLLTKELWDFNTGVLASLIYGTSPFLVGGANAISTDTLLVLWHSITYYSFWKAYKYKKKHYVYIFWLGLGLGCFTKGPMGLIPLLGIVPFCMWRWIKHKESLWHFISPVGIFIYIVIGLGWYFYENWKYPGLLKYWLLHETFGRLAQGEFDRNPEWYKIFPVYVAPILLGTGLWIFLLVYSMIKEKRTSKTPILFPEFNTIEFFFLLLIFTIPMIFFFVSKSRLSLYIIPLFIPLSSGMAKILLKRIENNIINIKQVLIIALVQTLIIIIGKGISGYIPNSKDMKQLADDLNPLVTKYQKVELFTVKSRELNGLEFYLHIPVPEIEIGEEAEKDFNKALGEIEEKVVSFLRNQSDKKKIILIPQKFESYLKTLPLPPQIEVNKVNKFWLAIHWEEK
ncbi:MAG: glycosyltransferase family 39 protein [Candidatus Hydrogenedentes bacterium]|nr:glycosyltransferase family 39 protein [Candidatus Hydrogenedentota bacterium]